MRTAEEILESHLIESDSGFERGVYIDGHGNYNGVIKAMKEYAKELAKEALKNASENATLNKETQYTGGLGISGLLYEETLVIDKQSILNESNIPNI